MRKIAASSKTSWSVALRSEEHTSELQSLMRISYAVFCLKQKKSSKYKKKVNKIAKKAEQRTRCKKQTTINTTITHTQNIKLHTYHKKHDITEHVNIYSR